MKKFAVTLAVMILVTLMVAPVLAHRWGGSGSYGGSGRGPCWQAAGGNGNLTENQRTDLEKLEQKFISDTAKLKEDIWTKSAELDTVLNSPDPDATRAMALQREIGDLKAQMGEHRLSFELEARKIAPNARYNLGYAGRKHHGGPGGPCGQHEHHGPCGHHGQYGHSAPRGGHGGGGCCN